MRLVIHPAMIEYLDDLRELGTAYHAATDCLEFVDKENEDARNHDTVSLWSPCGMLQPVRAFYTPDIVGVRFELCVEFLKQMDISPFGIESALDLLDLYASQSERWVHTMFEKKPEEVEDRIAQVQNFYEASRQFFAKHPTSSALPPVVHRKLVAAWRNKISPSLMQ